MSRRSSWRENYFEDGYLRRWSLEPGGETEAETAAAYLKLSGPPAEGAILDLGCGHGRYAIPLAAMGYDVWGLDGSRTLLRRARAHADGARQQVRWVRGDMRSLPFKAGFDVVLILDAFGYFDADGEDLRFLRGLRDTLRPEGRVVMRNPNGAWIRRQFKSERKEVRNDATTTLRSRLSEDGRWMHEDVTIEQHGSTHSYRRLQRIYAAEELDRILSDAQFFVLGHYDAGGGVFDGQTSTQVVTVAAMAGT